MGRKVMRVPLRFDWPIGKVWDGYVNPHWKACPQCDGRGTTVAAEWLNAITHLLLMVGETALDDRRPLHPWIAHLPLGPARRPGPDAVALTTGLAGRAPRGPFGHDSIDRYSATKKIIAAAGLPKHWGWCPECDGGGCAKEHKAAYEAWKATSPPRGKGWQVWETVSEGSPVSPVYATAAELVEWCVGQGYSRKAAESFVQSGWAPSGVMVPGTGYVRDIESAGIELPKSEET